MKRYDHLPHAALVALDLDQSKRFFAARGENGRLSFVQQLAADKGAPALMLDATWATLHRLLNRDDDPRTASIDTKALGMVLAGGRAMDENAGSLVCLLRPDLVPIVADTLQSFSVAWLDDLLRAELAEKSDTGDISPTAHLHQLTSLAERLQAFYGQAKQSTAAVAFAAWSSA